MGRNGKRSSKGEGRVTYQDQVQLKGATAHLRSQPPTVEPAGDGSPSLVSLEHEGGAAQGGGPCLGGLASVLRCVLHGLRASDATDLSALKHHLQ